MDAPLQLVGIARAQTVTLTTTVTYTYRLCVCVFPTTADVGWNRTYYRRVGLITEK